jgi:hypothetical protein
VLRDFETFSSAAGAGMANLNREEAWRKPSNILEVDPPVHTTNPAQYGPVFFFVMHPLLRAQPDAETLANWLYAIQLVFIAVSFFLTWAALKLSMRGADEDSWPLIVAWLAVLWLHRPVPGPELACLRQPGADAAWPAAVSPAVRVWLAARAWHGLRQGRLGQGCLLGVVVRIPLTGEAGRDEAAVRGHQDRADGERGRGRRAAPGQADGLGQPALIGIGLARHAPDAACHLSSPGPTPSPSW